MPNDAHHPPATQPSPALPPTSLTPEQIREDRTRKRGLTTVLWALIGLAGATGWTLLALARGETVNALWFVVTGVASFLIAYRFYSRFIERTIVRPDDTRATPAEYLANGTDYVATPRNVLFGHHFAAIAGAGPLVGPVLAAQWGFLPGTIWIIVGVIFAGAVQDYLVLFCSTRRGGRSIGQMARDQLGRIGGTAAIIATLLIMIIIVAILALVVVNALAESPWGVFSVGMTLPIALFMGAYLRWIRPGRITEISLIGFALLMLAIIGGGWVSATPWGQTVFTLDAVTLAWCVTLYGFTAAILPVWLLLAPRDYLSTFLKIGVILVLAAAVVIANPLTQAPAISQFVTSEVSPVVSGSIFPFLCVTIACGALSGFHALIASGTTPKMVQKERQTRFIGYGGMLMESFVALMALVAAVTLDQGIYYAMNASAAATGGSVQGAVDYVMSLGITGVDLHPDMLTAAAQAVGEDTIVSRTGGAPTLALGLANIMKDVLGGTAMMGFWYHFAIMFEALFILTAVDAGTRVARFMLQDAFGNFAPRFRDSGWRPGVWLTTALMVGAWGAILLMGVSDPLGGINTLFPLFGIANQLLAAIALAVCVAILAAQQRFRYLWVVAIPLGFITIITITASLYKICSPNPAIGYFARHVRYRDALALGDTSLGSVTAMQAVARNTLVQGVLSVVFLALAMIVLVTAALAVVRAYRHRFSRDTEDPYVSSRIFGPAGFRATVNERQLQRQWDALEADRHGSQQPKPGAQK